MDSQPKIRLEPLRLTLNVVVNQVFGDLVDEPKRSTHQYEQANSKPDADLPLQIGFAKDAFDAAVGHDGMSFESAARNVAIVGVRCLPSQSETTSLRCSPQDNRAKKCRSQHILRVNVNDPLDIVDGFDRGLGAADNVLEYAVIAGT